MIKAVARGPASTNVILGLSDGNWARLRKGEPILVRLRELDPDLPDIGVILLGGETEQSLAEDLRVLGPVRDD